MLLNARSFNHKCKHIFMNNSKRRDDLIKKRVKGGCESKEGTEEKGGGDFGTLPDCVQVKI